MALSLLSYILPHHDPEEVLVREPGERRYGPPRPAAELARESWEYALLSAWAYRNGWDEQVAKMARIASSDAKRWRETIDAHWGRWTEIPSESLRQEAEKVGLYFDIYESKATVGKKRIVIAFRGTEGLSWRDWRANLRWFTRFIPAFHDQYTVVAEDLVREFAREIASRDLNGDGVEIITTGHSLGGGLAQQFAYALKAPEDMGITVQPVSYVYAFHPSPVTGWFSVPKEVRDRNVEKLRIDRIFEHGEILAYVRLLLSQFYPPSASKPEIREIRFNFDDSRSSSANHEIESFAFHLAERAQASTRVDAGETAPISPQGPTAEGLSGAG